MGNEKDVNKRRKIYTVFKDIIRHCCSHIFRYFANEIKYYGR